MSEPDPGVFDDKHVGCRATIEELYDVINKMLTNKDSIYRKYDELFRLARRLTNEPRGCNCDYDFRCTGCQAKIDIGEFVRREFEAQKNVT